MRSTISVIIALASLLVASCTERPDSKAFVDNYVQTHRSGDVDGLLAMHTGDAEFVMVGQDPIRGTAALRDLFEWDAVLKSDLSMDAVSADGDTIVVDSVTERNRWFRAIGLSVARFQPGTRILLEDGRIAGTYPAAFEDETGRVLGDGFERIVAWLGHNRPDTLKQLLPGGKFRYDAQSARLWLKVFEEWKSSERPGE
jgi:SnoaL-like domain